MSICDSYRPSTRSKGGVEPNTHAPLVIFGVTELSRAAMILDLAQERFEVDSANAARSFLNEQGIPAHQIQSVWDAIALHSTRSIALHKEPEVAMKDSGIAVDVLGAGLDLIPQDKVRAILAEFPRLSIISNA